VRVNPSSAELSWFLGFRGKRKEWEGRARVFNAKKLRCAKEYKTEEDDGALMMAEKLTSTCLLKLKKQNKKRLLQLFISKRVTGAQPPQT